MLELELKGLEIERTKLKRPPWKLANKLYNVKIETIGFFQKEEPHNTSA